jgi:hypothetical protein
MGDEESQKRPAEQRRRPQHEVVRLWGIAVLGLGLASATLIYVFAADDPNADAARQIAEGRMYQHDLEVIGGKLMVHLVQFNDWFASLWHGTSLALTVAVLSVAISVGFLWVAHLMANAPPEDQGEDRRS